MTRDCHLVTEGVEQGEDGLHHRVPSSGILRIYQPRSKGFKPDDLLLELQLDAPVLQLGAGRCHLNLLREQAVQAGKRLCPCCTS